MNDEKMGNYGHPCPKPIGWAKWIIKRFCPEGGLVLDPFAGSGTVLKAARDMKRSYIGIDLSPKYCEIARKRSKNALVGNTVEGLIKKG
jgi:site-specific DNA-methyltransferase (adenine-specific)